MNRSSVFWRIMLQSSLASLVITVAFSALNAVSLLGSLKQDLAAEVSQEADELALILPGLIWNFDEEGIDRVLATKMRDTNLYSISLETRDVLARTFVRDGQNGTVTKKIPPIATAFDGSMLSRSREISYGDSVIARIVITFSPKEKEAGLLKLVAGEVVCQVAVFAGVMCSEPSVKTILREVFSGIRLLFSRDFQADRVSPEDLFV